jgi:signal transduction histidine kinase
MTARLPSLRLKLALWYLLVFSAIQVSLGLGVVTLRRDAIRRAVDAEVARAAENFLESLLAGEEPRFTSEELVKNLPEDVDFTCAAVRDANGIPVALVGVDEPGDLPWTPSEQVPTGPLGPAFTNLVGENAERLVPGAAAALVITLPFRIAALEEEAPPRTLYLQAAVAPARVRALGPYFDFLLVGIPVGIAGALVAGWLIAGRAVAPLRQLSTAAREVSPERLGERIEVRSGDSEVRTLLADLNQALERIEAGYAAQRRFLGNVSHELKTPLTVLSTESQVLLAGAPEREELLDHAQSVREESDRLARLVDSLLLLSRSELAREALPREAVSLHDVVLDAVEHVQPAAREREVRIAPQLAEDGEPVVHGQPELLRALVENLLRNAVRFSPIDDVVQILVRSENEDVVLEVRDRGPGVPDAWRERVFEPFERGPVEGPDTARGAGLGLAIARGVARLHGGGLEAAEAPGGGCSMRARLPQA